MTEDERAEMQSLFDDWVEAEYMAILATETDGIPAQELRSRAQERSQRLGLAFRPDRIV